MKTHHLIAAGLAVVASLSPNLHGQDAGSNPLVKPLPAVLELLTVKTTDVRKIDALTKDANLATTLVLKGEDIYDVARRLFGDESLWTLVWQFNRDQLGSPDDLKPGMRLKVPPYSLSGKPSDPTSPGAKTDAKLDTAAKAGGITTRSPQFPTWFKEAAGVAKKTWNMPKVTNRYGKAITEEDFLRAILFIESRGVHKANGKVTHSGAGAIGFMQLMPNTAKGLGVDPNDPRQNLIGGARYLAQCFASKGTKVSDDSPADKLAKAAAAYNTGPGRQALASNTWTKYVGVGGTEPVYYGIQLKMALGIDLNATEQSWVARHKGISPANMQAFATDIYSRTQGTVNA